MTYRISDFDAIFCDSCNRTPGEALEQFYSDGDGTFVCASCLADYGKTDDELDDELDEEEEDD